MAKTLNKTIECRLHCLRGRCSNGSHEGNVYVAWASRSWGQTDRTRSEQGTVKAVGEKAVPTFKTPLDHAQLCTLKTGAAYISALWNDQLAGAM